MSASSASGAQVSFSGLAGAGISYDPDSTGAFESLALGETTTDTITYTIVDSHGATSTSTVTVTVTGTNDGPVANVDSAMTDENTAITVDVLANDTDVDPSDTHTVDSVRVADGQGTATIVDNQLQWTPGTDFDYLAVGETATVVVDYTMSDNHGASSSSTLTLTVTGTNDGPVAVDDVVTGGAAERVVLDFNGALSLSDYQGYAFTSFTHYRFDFGDGDNTMAYTYFGNNITSLGGADGAIQRADGEDFALNSFRVRSYTQNHDVTVLGYDDGVLVGSQVLSLTPSYQTVTFSGAWSSVDQVRFDMSSSEFYYTFLDNIDLSHEQGPTEDTPLDIDVLANDFDVDVGDTISISSFDGTSALGATVSLNADGTLHYDPTASGTLQALAADGSATDTFSYTITDGNGGTDSATVTVEVAGVNDAPVAAGDSVVTDEDTAVTIRAADLLANDTDVDSGDVLTITSVANAANGTVALDANGDVVFTPDRDFNGQASFDYTVSDGNGGTDTATVSLDVSAVNDGPTITLPGLSGSGGSISVAVTYGNVTDGAQNQIVTLLSG